MSMLMGMMMGGFGSAAQAYYDLVISLSPTAYWRLGESSGTTAFDEIGSNDGTYTDGPLLGQTGLITGDADTCIRLDGSNDLVTMGDVLNPGTSDFSVVIWYKQDTQGFARRLIDKRGTGSGGASAGWAMLIQAANEWTPIVDAGDGSFAIFASGITDGLDTDAHMAALTWDNSGQALKIYIDGVDKGTAPVTGSLSGKSISTTRPLSFGCADNGGGGRSQFFDGFEDEAAFWLGTVLTPTNISDLYDAGTGA